MVGALDLEQEESVTRVVGGPCEYKEYRGKATIVSIIKINSTIGGKEVENESLFFESKPTGDFVGFCCMDCCMRTYVRFGAPYDH